MKYPLLLCLILFVGNTAAAQDIPKTDVAPTALTTTNATIDVEELTLRLKPLTKIELIVEADAWQRLVQAKVAEISKAEIAGLRSSGDVAKEKVEQANAMREDRTALIDRQKIVLKSLREKGAGEEEILSYTQYLQAVSGLVINAKKPSSAVTAIRGWVVSGEGGIRWALNLVKFVLVLFLTGLLAGMVGRVMRKVTDKIDFSELLVNFIINASRNVVKILGLIVALSMLEVNIGPLVAGVGVLGFIVGFALQDTLGNFASGFMILLYRPYDVGDFVTAGGVSGTVVAMSLVSTTFKTPDNQKVVVPNGKIWGDTIKNTTGNNTRRIDLLVGCGYDDDLAKVQGVLEGIVAEQDAVLDDPEPFIGVIELGDSSVNFGVRPWVNTEDYWGTRCALTRRVKERFDEEGISIPYPTQQVHLARD